MEAYFSSVTSSYSWATAVDLLKRKRSFIQGQLRAGNYDVILDGVEAGGSDHFVQQARAVQREAQAMHNLIQERMAEAQSVADVSASVAQQLVSMPPPHLPSDNGGNTLHMLLSGQGPEMSSLLPFSALHAQLNFNHNTNVQLSGWQQQSYGLMVSNISAQSASNSATAAAMEHLANAVDHANALQSQQLNILLELASRTSGHGGVPTGSGLVAHGAQLRLLPPPQFGDLAESTQVSSLFICLTALMASLTA